LRSSLRNILRVIGESARLRALGSVSEELFADTRSGAAPEGGLKVTDF
jgi:hypothetical protein